MNENEMLIKYMKKEINELKREKEERSAAMQYACRELSSDEQALCPFWRDGKGTVAEAFCAKKNPHIPSCRAGTVDHCGTASEADRAMCWEDYYRFLARDVAERKLAHLRAANNATEMRLRHENK